MNEKVSIIIPTYKRNELLSRAIDSSLAQTYLNIEILVIDDNTPNSSYRAQTEKIMDKYSHNNKVIYLKNKENVGGSLARNRGIQAASGEFVTFLDDDDEYNPNKVERQLAFMVKNGCDMSFSDISLVNEKGKLVDYRCFADIPQFNRETLLKYHIMRHITGTPTFMYKREKLVDIGGFDDVSMGQEFYLMIKTIEKGLCVAYLNGCDVVAYRHSSGGISFGNNKIKGEKELFDFKQKYYHLFSNREKKFIKFRHFAVMAVAYKRNRNYIRMFSCAVLMVLESPFDTLRETFLFLSRTNTKKKVRA